MDPNKKKTITDVSMASKSRLAPLDQQASGRPWRPSEADGLGRAVTPNRHTLTGSDSRRCIFRRRELVAAMDMSSCLQEGARIASQAPP